jgi:hypothetical protein
MNAVRAQRPEHPSNLRPSFAEDFLLIFLSLLKNIVAEIRGSIYERIRKIKKKWLRNNRHLYRPAFLINPEQLRHIQAENTRNVLFPQPFISAAFPFKRDLLAVKLYCEKSWFCIVFSGEDNTMNAKP